MADWDVVSTEPASSDPWSVKSVEPAGSMSWRDVPGKALKNLGPSALKFGESIVQPLVHPVDTAKAMGNLGLGEMEMATKSPLSRIAASAIPGIGPAVGLYQGAKQFGLAPETGHEQYPKALAQSFMDRYGGVENLKQTLATDPVGALGDASMLMTGGGSAMARAPGMAAKVGETVRKVGSAIDPIANIARITKGAGHLAAGTIGNLGTQTGGAAIRTAAQAGAEGGERARAFQQNLRGVEPLEATVEEARGALRNIREERGRAYREGMIPIKDDKTILNFNDIDRALTEGRGTFKGEEVNPAASRVRDRMWNEVERWKNLQASEYHTAEGFDALKKKLGAIREEIPFEQATARAVANEIYGAVNNTIRKQAPEYAKVMKGYESASKQIRELEKTLSLNPNASIDTTLRKLQSALRDNVHTSFGHRKELAELLMKSGAPHLMERLAGQALKPWMPRGLAKLLGLELVASGHGKWLSMMSPRLAGEGAYYAGKAWPYVPKSSAVSIPGRAASALEPREMLKNDAREALRDKDRTLTKQERELLRMAARGDASAADLMRVRKLLDRQAPNEPVQKGDRPSYGGPQ